MMTPRIAHVVLDLPLEGPFDYAVPTELQQEIAVGKRVSVAFGHSSAVGYVTGLAETSTIKDLKPVRAVLDISPVMDEVLLSLARSITARYGCTMGQAIGLMMPRLWRSGRKAEQAWPAFGTSSFNPNLPQFVCHDEHVLFTQIRQALEDGRSSMVLVPDIFAMDRLRPSMQKIFGEASALFHQPKTPGEELAQWIKVRSEAVKIAVGTRSSVFLPMQNLGLIAVVDEGDPSYREEQTPFYETRDVALMRAKIQGAQVLLMSQTPSVEAWHQFGGGNVLPSSAGAAMNVVDLSNYKYVEKGIISIPLRGRLEEALKAKALSILVLNRRGLYAVTRCKECALILSCPRCSSAMTFSRRDKCFICPHCTSTLPSDVICPKCNKPDWKSFGMGVEKLQSELNTIFPQAKVVSFERGDASLPSGDIVIATQAILRFKDRLKPQLTALVDLDSELNRLDMRSSYRAWSLALRVRAMAQKIFIVQTRNNSHHVVKALAADDPQLFYDEERRLRKELRFTPFAHWAAVTVRGRQEKSVLNLTQDIYNALSAVRPEGTQVLEPAPGLPAKMRGQYRFQVLVQGSRPEGIVSFIKEGLAGIKRSSRLIVTIELDP